MTIRNRLLIMTDWFCPGFKAGGSITSCYNLAMLLKDEYIVYILTSDRDLGDRVPYNKIATNQWIDFDGGVKVYYASPEGLSWRNIIREVKKVRADFIYLNSMYSIYFTIYPLLMKRLGLISQHIFLSPGGMLKDSALKMKAFKKEAFLFVLNVIRIQNVICFHATDDQENKDIANKFGRKAIINQVYFPPPIPENSIFYPQKKSGELKLVFLGRIHPIKNLHFLIECLKKTPHHVELNVVGPNEDVVYFSQCKELANSLPINVTVSFVGSIEHERVKNYLKENHFLALPTAGENFGYAILEALCVGRPVIITDKTPWKDLEQQKAGWDLPFNNHREFIRAIDFAANMTQDEYNKWSESSWNFAYNMQKAPMYKNQYVQMFNKLT